MQHRTAIVPRNHCHGLATLRYPRRRLSVRKDLERKIKQLHGRSKINESGHFSDRIFFVTSVVVRFLSLLSINIYRQSFISVRNIISYLHYIALFEKAVTELSRQNRGFRHYSGVLITKEAFITQDNPFPRKIIITVINGSQSSLCRMGSHTLL